MQEKFYNSVNAAQKLARAQARTKSEAKLFSLSLDILIKFQLLSDNAKSGCFKFYFFHKSLFQLKL